MLSPGTHLVKNHESQSTTNESQLKKESPKLKMLGPLCNQSVNPKTDSQTLPIFESYETNAMNYFVSLQDAEVNKITAFTPQG